MQKDPEEEALEAILSSLRSAAPSADDPDDVRLRADAARAAKFLIELYGDDALNRARRIEEQSPSKHFARLVRRKVEDSR